MQRKESGHQGRKRKAESEAAHAKLLGKVPKMTKFYKPERTDDSTATGAESVESGAQAQSHSSAHVTETEDQPSTSKDVAAPAPAVFKFDKDPANWKSNDKEELIDHLAAIKFPDRNIAGKFPESMRVYQNQRRYLSKDLFSFMMPNGEKVERDWLIYSKSTGNVYCFVCKLFSIEESPFVNGFSDWKNATRGVEMHENSMQHRNCAVTWSRRCSRKSGVYAHLQSQCEKEYQYWREVLKRVIEVTKFLCQRSLPFRGNNESIGSPQNGNFLGIIELLAKFDPFMEEHLERYGNKGRGNPSYLSSTVYEELIQLLTARVSQAIVDEVKASKYYAISVDSTPDISHTDQLTFTLRYVKKCGKAVERFVMFIPIESHKAQDLFTVVMEKLKQLDIPIDYCRGQTYDNASNMAGKYSGLQQRIKNVNPLASFIPCAAHSLNLVGVSAAESALWAVKYFDFVQKLYNFFSATTHRWNCLLKSLKDGGTVLRNLSVTRWSARADAAQSLMTSYHEIQQALMELANDTDQKSETRVEAESLASKFEVLEVALMAILWDKILQRLNRANLSLQAPEIDIGTVVKLYDSLVGYIDTLRDENVFADIEEKAMQLANCESYKTSTSRKKIRKKHFDENPEEDLSQDPSAEFRVNSYYVILDNLKSGLAMRSTAYKEFNDKFGFLNNLTTLSADHIREGAKHLMREYPNDITSSFEDELVHFGEFMKTYDDHSLPNMLLIIRSDSLQSTYPNTDIVLRIFLSNFATNCTGERSFSKLKRIKNELRSNMGDSRLSALTLLSIENDILDQLLIDDVVADFASAKARKKLFLKV